PALGSAIHAAVAAGEYPDIREAAAAMGSEPGDVYTPIPENVAAYEELFREYRTLHDYFGRGANDVMHRLKAIQRRSSTAVPAVFAAPAAVSAGASV
ncbi:MAG TPA: ribulokinase, partial [Arthrobacter sp.]|nr:ribulokinase [Arthrobacter sp.]